MRKRELQAALDEARQDLAAVRRPARTGSESVTAPNADYVLYPLPINGTRSRCRVCGRPIHAIDAAWVHDRPHDPWAAPIHAPRPVQIDAEVGDNYPTLREARHAADYRDWIITEG